MHWFFRGSWLYSCFDAPSLQAALAEVLQIAGRIDVLVNNAGMGYSGPVAEVKLDVVRQLYETNVLGAMAMVQAVFPHMVNKGKGRIVNIGSMAAYVHRFARQLLGARQKVLLSCTLVGLLNLDIVRNGATAYIYHLSLYDQAIQRSLLL